MKNYNTNHCPYNYHTVNVNALSTEQLEKKMDNGCESVSVSDDEIELLDNFIFSTQCNEDNDNINNNNMNNSLDKFAPASNDQGNNSLDLVIELKTVSADFKAILCELKGFSVKKLQKLATMHNTL